MLCLDVICWEVLNCGYSPGLLRDDIWLSMAVLKSLEIHSFLGYEQDLASNRKSYAKNQAKGLTAQHSSRNPKNHPQ